MSKLKVGLFLDNYYPSVDGVLIAVENIAKNLCEDNDVSLIVPYSNTVDTDKEKPYKVKRVTSIPVPLYDYRLGISGFRWTKLYQELIEENFDIVHIHSPFTIGKLGVKIAKDSNIPCVATMHSRFDWEIKRIIDNDFIINTITSKLVDVYNKCDDCTTVNNAMIDVLKQYGYKKNPIVLGNGTDLETVSDGENARTEINNLYNLSDNDIMLLFVGRITSIKNIFFMLGALRELDKDGFDFKMFFVGTGPEEKELMSKIKSYGLENKVFMLGEILDRELLAKIYYRSDLFLFPSLADTSSLVQKEAASQYTPTLFIENSITADEIVDGYNGFTAKYDVISYKNKIKQIISNKDELLKVSMNAKNTIARSWKEITTDLSELYSDEINKKSKILTRTHLK